MIEFCDGEIRDIIPVNLLSPETEAISYAVGQALRKLQRFAASSSVCAGIKEVPEKVLDLMALEFNTQYYDQTLPREVKESLIARTILWYMRAGTRAVLEEFLETVLDGGEVTEWHQYGGEPYYFKALVDVGEHEIPLGYSQTVRRQIDIYKNKRSWLEVLVFIYKTRFKVPVRYETDLTFNSQFYPRYNLEYLQLDGTWKLDGKRRLNGYNSEKNMDFYPICLAVGMDVNADAEFSDVIEIASEIGCVLTEEADTKCENDVQIEVIEGCRAEIVTDVTQEISAGQTEMTVLNRLDGTWKLDGKRRLNGGLTMI